MATRRLDTQTKSYKEEALAERLARAGSWGIVLKEASCTRGQCFICCSEFALCKACKEGIRKTFFWKPGWMENRGAFWPLPWGENKPLCLFYCYLCICISEQEARNLILNTRKTRSLFYCYWVHDGKEEQDTLGDFSQRRHLWGFACISLRTKQAWSWDKKVLMSNYICFSFTARWDFLRWGLRPRLALDEVPTWLF